METYSLKKDVKKLFKQKENTLGWGVIQWKILSKSFFYDGNSLKKKKLTEALQNQNLIFGILLSESSNRKNYHPFNVSKNNMYEK